MYFGSVNFFKHLILSAISLIIVVSISLTVIFGIRYNIEHNKAVDVMAKYDKVTAEDRLNIPDDLSLNDLYSALKNSGYTTADIIAALDENDKETMSEIYKNQFYQGDLDTQVYYDSLYPELYVTPPTEFVTKSKTIYLTFDDGPSENTVLILSILQKYDIKATFFMCGSQKDEGKAIMKSVADAGHSIGIHSLSHNYTKIYENMDAYLEDFNNTYNNIFEATGIKPDIFRFPGGSINNYNRLIYKQLIAETTRRGFVYYDWNVSGEDASTSSNWTSIYSHVMSGIKDKDRAIILLHDSNGKDQTVTVLEDLIIELKNQGFSFDKITNDVKPTTFDYIN